MGANAQTSVPAFTAGQVLTAAQMTQVNTGIPVFASSTERDAAFGGTGEKTLAEGQYAFLEDTNETQVYDGSSWGAVSGGKILQVVSTAKTDTFSASVASGAVSGAAISASITPTSASSKVFILATISTDNSNTSDGSAVIYRGGSVLSGATGDSAGSRRRDTSGMDHETADGRVIPTGPIMYLDSPATTSATTYDIRLGTDSALTQTVYLNRSASNPDTSAASRPISTLTLVEVSA